MRPTQKRKRGGQPGNCNAAGHGAPFGNKNAYKHGLYEPFPPLILHKAGVSLEHYDNWFWGNIAKLGYTRAELQDYHGRVQLFMQESPAGEPEPDRIKVYCGKTVVFDSGK